MSPELRARITARNETAAGFAEVKRDAVATADAVEASSDRAATAMMRHNTALVAMGQSNRMAAQTSRMLAFQLNDIAVSLASGMNPAMVAVQQGSQIAQLGLANVGRAAVGMITKFAPIAVVVGAGAAALAGLQREINKTSDVQVSFGDTALAVWQVFADGVYDLIEPAIAAIAPWFDTAWQRAVDATYNTVNLMTKGMMLFVAQVELVAGSIGNIFSLTWQDVANGAIDVFQSIIDSFMTDINAVRRLLGQDPLVVRLTGMKFEGGRGWDEGLLEKYNARKATIEGTDYAGAFFDSVSKRAQGNALNRLAEDAEKASGALKAANDNIDPFKSRISELADVLTLTQDPFQQMMTDLTDIRTLYEHGRISAEQFGQATFKTMANTAASTLGVVGQLTGAMSQLFKDNKAFAVANAVINTAEGVTKALAQGGIFGFVGAAAVAASGAAQIAAILSASPGGGGSVAPVGGAPAAAANQNAPQPRALNITLHGATQNTVDVEALVRRIVSYYDDRDQVLVTAHK